MSITCYLVNKSTNANCPNVHRDNEDYLATNGRLHKFSGQKKGNQKLNFKSRFFCTLNQLIGLETLKKRNNLKEIFYKNNQFN